MPREALLARTLVELADTLVDDFDVVELLTLLADRCVEVLDVAAAGLMLAAPEGDLRVMASSSEAMRVLELFEIQSQQGPCLDCHSTGQPIVNHRLASDDGRWPRFSEEALAAGFKSVHALPMRLRDVTIGALNLFRVDEGALNEADVNAAQALADVATIAVLQHHDIRDAQVLSEQLHHAINSRIVLEQAKGMVATGAGIDIDQAFSWLHHYARSRNLRLVDVARAVATGTLPPTSLSAPRRSPVKAVATQPEARTEALASFAAIEPMLVAVEAAAPADAVEVVVRELAAMLGVRDVSFLIADSSGDSLIRFVRSERALAGAAEPLETVAMAGTSYERALVSQAIQAVPEDGGHRLLAPVSDRGEALGVLELVVDPSPDESLMQEVASAAHTLAYVLIANSRHTDLFESAQRSAPFSLAAEIQRRLLPSAFTCETERFTFAGWLEPANHVGGDTFDYSVDREALHVSLTDAMGHGVEAAQLATLVLGSLRNTRRAGLDLAERARRANAEMITHATEDQFVTGLLLRADLRNGRVALVNAGHPLPYLLRGGRVRELELAPDLPFGMTPDSSYRTQELQLDHGDRLVAITDGFLERNVLADLDAAAAVLATAELHPREVAQEFKSSVLAATGGELGDDAAILCIDWRGSTA